MSDILKEIYIKQAQRQKAAGTESEKIASVNAAYAQAQKVKKQRQINDQRQKAGALQVRSIEQGTAAKGALQKATEEIGLAQEQRDARYNLYMDLTSKGIYDPNAAAALGVSKKTYDRVLAKVQAARAPKVTAKATNDVVVEENEQEQELFDPKNVTYSQQQAANRRAMNDDVDGDGQRGRLSDDKLTQREIAAIEGKMQKEAETLAKEERTTPLTVEERAAKRRAMNDDVSGVGQRGLNSETSKKKQIAQIEQHQNVDTKTATMVYNLNTAVQKHGREKVLESMMKYVDKSGDASTALQKIFDLSEKKETLLTNQRAFLTVLRNDSRLSAEQREVIDTVIYNDTVYKIDSYKAFLESLDVEKLEQEVATPTSGFGLDNKNKQMVAYAMMHERDPYVMNGWKMVNTGEDHDADSAKERQIAYEKNEQRLAEIDAELTELDRQLQQERSGVVFSAEAAEFGQTTSIRTTEENEKYNALVKEKEELLSYRNLYLRGAKVTDDYFARYAGEKDYADLAGKRAHGNATNDEFNEYFTRAYGGALVSWEDGSRQHIQASPEYERTAAREKLQINDPLGFYFDTALSNYAEGETDYYSPDHIGTDVPGSNVPDPRVVMQEGYNDHWEMLNENEIEMYYYLFNKQGTESALKFLDDMQTQLDYRSTERSRKAVENADGFALVVLNALSIPANIVGGIAAFADDAARLLQGKEINPYSNMHGALNFAESVRSATANKIDTATGGDNVWNITWGDAYQSIMSGADSAIGASVFGKGYTVLMGAGAASSAMKDLYERGASKGQIMFGGAVAGAAELIFEKFSIERFLKAKNSTSFLKWATNVLKLGVTEMSEEVATEIAGVINDAMTMNTQSEWSALIEKHDGVVTDAVIETLKEKVWKSGAGGFISGVFMGSGGTSINYAANRSRLTSEGKKMVERGNVPFVQAVAHTISGETGGKIAAKLEKKASKVSAEKFTGEGLKKIIAGIRNGRNYRNIGRLSVELGSYGDILQQVYAGKTLSEIRASVKQTSDTSPKEVGRIVAEIKKGFVSSLSDAAKEAYTQTASDPKKAAMWVRMYNAGLNDVEISTFANDWIPAKEAKEAYEFGKAAQVTAEDVSIFNETVENTEDTAVFDVDSDELARRLTIAGRNGLEIEEVYDGEITDTMRAIYNEGKRGDGEIGTTTVTVHKGSGTLRDKTGGRYNPQLNVEQLRRFAKVTGIDVEIAPDGSVDGKAAFEVGAFKILVSESATMGDFMHEVLESMAALSAEDFNHVSKMLVRHFLDHNHTLEELDDGIAQKMVDYNTKSYPFARKEWVCDYAGRLLSSGDGLEAFLGWLDQHDKSGRAKKSLAEFIKALWEKLKAMCNGDWIGTAEKRRGQKLTDELQGIIDGLENTRTKLASLENGQTVEVGGGEGIVRNHLPFYSMKEKDVNRIGWAEELFSDEDKLLLNDRFVDIMIHKDLGDAVRLKGGSYLLDVNNKIVIIGGSFKNPAIHFVMVINTDNATYAQEMKEVIFDYEKGRSGKVVAREVAKRLKVFETHIGKELVRAYNGQDFGYSPTSAHLYARLPEGFISYGYTGTQRDGGGVSAEDGGTGELRYSLDTTATAEETEAAKRALPSADAQMIGKLTAEMDELARNSGKLPQGERVKRDIAVPRKVNGKKTMLWARTFFESGVGTPEMVDPVSAEVLAQGLSYKVVGDKAAISSAESALSADGYEAAIEKFIEAADLMEQGNGGFNLKSGKVTVAKGQLLLRAAAERKDYHNFKRLVVILSEIETLAGQVVQAASMLKKMGGEVKLFEVKRTVDRINRELSQGKYGKSGADMKISIEDTVDRYNRDLAGGRYGEKNTGRIITVKPELIDQLIAAGNDGDAANKIVVEIYKDIAKQLPSSFADKWNTWRYLAMLFNPTTHFRNILSNAIFTLPLEIKNTLQWAIEAGIGIFRTETERSATVSWSKQAMEFAKQDALEMELSLKSGGKYNEQDIIDQYRDRFKSRWLKWIDGGSRFNSALLEKEDWWFLKGHYARALARYITANKLDADNMTVEQLTRARDHAIKQAQKATFRDASQFANAISAFSKAHPVANVLAESVMPFKKTPINILKRGMEYSPLGLISTLSYGSVQLARGKVSANEYIGQLAAGLTGSMIVYLGFILAKLGLLRGGLGRDDEDRENRAKDKLLRLEGAQEFSLVIGDHTYTLDWMAPASIPLFIGVELYDAFADNDKKLMDKAIDALLDGTDVIVNTSMLSGLEGFVDALKYDDNVVLGALGNTAVNYVSQGFPTLVGRITSTMDGKRRVNYIDKTSWAPEILQELGNKFFTKFWPWAKPVYYDEFGREDQNTNVFGRFLENFFSPGYYSKNKSGDLEEVMQEIYEATDEPTPIPTTAAKSFKVNGETRQLKAKEYETFSKNRGQIAYDIMKDTIKSDAFKKMDAESQAKVLKEAYTYANAIAKTKAVNCDLEDVITNATKWIVGAEEIKGKIPVADIIVYRQLISEDSLGSGKRMDAVQALRKAGMSEQNAFDYVGKIRSGYAGDTGGTDYAVSDIYLSLKNGGTSYEMIYKDLLEAYRERGKTEKEARSIIRTGLTRLFKADYLAASPSERKEIVAMLNKSGAYGTKSDVSDTVVDWYNESLENK